MRLRRIATVTAVATAAAATVFATTAALFPAAPPDPMQPLPALTGRALTARYAADAAAIARAASSARRSGDPALARALDAMRGRHFLSFDPRGPGEAIEVLGDLATAARVAILVPGSDTSLATFGSRGTASPAGAAAALAAQARRLDPGARLAVVAWLGYRTPATFSPGVLTSGDAGQGAGALRPLVTDLARHGARVALLCHSYGTVVCGLAAPHLPVTDIAVFGSPGMDASSVRQLHTGARVWAGRGGGDWMRYVPHVQLLGLGFGPDPTAPAFGARPFGCGAGGHSGYFRPGGTALRNLAYIALGDPAGVTR
ncbi:MAG TPA: alpha/beta hydrolase [Streptosporangiaceae bacterium]